MPASSVPLAAIRQPAFLYDAGGRVVEANDLIESLAGRPLAGCSIADVEAVFRMRPRGGAPYPLAELPVSQALAGEEAVDVPLEITASDGQTQHVLATASPIRDGDAVTGALVVWQDVTGLVAAETALGQSKEEYRLLVQHAPSAFYEIDIATSRFRRVNNAMCEVLGYTREELMAMDPAALLDDESRARFAERVRKASAGESIDPGIAYRLFAKDGRAIWAELSVTLTHTDGMASSAFVIAHDITERKAAEAGLRESEAHLARAQKIAHVGSWAWDIPGDRLSWSDEAYRILGLQPGEIPTPGTEDFFAFIHPDDRPRVTRVMQDALVRGDYDVEFRFVRKGGGEGYAHSQAAVTFANGAPVRMEGTVQDTTERKRAEEGQARLQALMDHNPCLVFLKDESGRYVYLNETYERQFALTKDWYGQTDYDIWPKESAELFRANDREVLESG